MNLLITITKTLHLHPERMREGVIAAVHEGTALLEKNVKQRAPVGVGGAAGLKGSIFGEVTPAATRVEGIVGTPIGYAMPVEFGRRAGAAMPPVSALIPWVEAKITLKQGEKAEGVAWAIARYMAQRGSRSWRSSPPGERMFLRGFEASVPGIIRIFEQRTIDVLARTME